MPSNFNCVGFRVDSQEDLLELVQHAMQTAELIGKGARGAEAYRWEDPSGARLVLDFRGTNFQNLLPSFAGTATTLLGDVFAVNDDTSMADVVDEDGQTITRLAVDLEQRALISGSKVRGPTSLAALVGQITVHADTDAFAVSPESLLGTAEDAGEAPAHFVEQGLPWPPRFGAESFVSMGAFEAARDVRPIARLNGIVVEADERTNSMTGLKFVRARVRTVGFEADVCAPPSELPRVPAAGEVVSAAVYMVGSLREWDVVAGASGVGSRLSRLFGRGRN